MHVGAEKVAEAIATGAGEAAAVGALTLVCPPAGLIVGGVLLAKKAYTAADHAYHMASDKTQAERKRHAKLAVIDFLSDNLD
jgi:hypothetical protein